MTELGYNLPLIEGEKLKKLKEIYPIQIGSLANPLDLPWLTADEVYLKICRAAIDEDIDFVMIVSDAWSDLEGDRFKNYYNNLLGIKAHVESLDKT